MESNWIELKKETLPASGQTIWLKGQGISGDKVIHAEFYNENGNLSFKWVRKDFEQGICTLSNPTHWKPFSHK